jgi:CheY-like chemotaxis protein
MESEMSFIDETEDILSSVAKPWKILITDDEVDVHTATVFSLASVVINNRPIEFLHAYSGKEAISIIASDSNIDLMILDAVMETEDAGLLCARHVKFVMNRNIPVIVMRTGFAGWELELKKANLKGFAGISDFLLKSEASREILVKMLTKLLVPN